MNRPPPWWEHARQGFAGGTSLTMNTRSPGLIRPEVAAGNLFDRRRIFPEAPRHLAQPRILHTLARDGRRQRVVFLARAQDRQQAALSDKAVDNDDRRHEQQQQVDDSPVPPGRFRLQDCASRRGRVRSCFDTTSRNSTSTSGKVQANDGRSHPYPDDHARMTTVLMTLARTLVEERLAACVNVHGPMVRPTGGREQLERETERQVVIKTTAASAAASRGAAASAASVRAARVHRDGR